MRWSDCWPAHARAALIASNGGAGARSETRPWSARASSDEPDSAGDAREGKQGKTAGLDALEGPEPIGRMVVAGVPVALGCQVGGRVELVSGRRCGELQRVHLVAAQDVAVG